MNDASYVAQLKARMQDRVDEIENFGTTGKTVTTNFLMMLLKQSKRLLQN